MIVKGKLGGENVSLIGALCAPRGVFQPTNAAIFEPETKPTQSPKLSFFILSFFFPKMKLNSSVVIYGTRVILVPYEREHVPKYHEWMKDQEILEATASEPLTLEKEFEMQKSWREDEDKLTFILLSAQMIEEGKTELEAMIGKALESFLKSVLNCKHNGYIWILDISVSSHNMRIKET